eukprot:3444480-Amphidinium_carterae.1
MKYGNASVVVVQLISASYSMTQSLKKDTCCANQWTMACKFPMLQGQTAVLPLHKSFAAQMQ